MKTERVFITDRGDGHFRKGEPAEVTGVKMVTPDSIKDLKFEPRLCYELRYEDGFVDYTPVNDKYKLRTLQGVIDLALKDEAIRMMEKQPIQLVKKQPPLGIIPNKFWKEKRYLDLHHAIERYHDEGFVVPPEWVDERNELYKEIYVK